MSERLDWWADTLREHMTISEMLTAVPRDDWRVEFFDYVREEPPADGSDAQEIRVRKVPREPQHEHERALAVFDINRRLGMVQGKHFISGQRPDEQPNSDERRVAVQQIGADKLRALVEKAEVTVRALGYDLDTGCMQIRADAYVRGIPPPSPRVAFDWGFLWIALCRIDWIRPPEGGRLRMSQLDAICDMLGVARVNIPAARGTTKESTP